MSLLIYFEKALLFNTKKRDRKNTNSQLNKHDKGVQNPQEMFLIITLCSIVCVLVAISVLFTLCVAWNLRQLS
jgi:hypothetical protein